jgi:hypothetical protein
MFDDLYLQFTHEERALLAGATVDDVMAADDSLTCSLPTSLRFKFMNLVTRQLPAIPLEYVTMRTDPR